MSRSLLALALAGLILACDGTGPITTCPGGALCARSPVVVTGTLQASAVPIPDAVVTLTAYQDSCGGTPAQLMPDPAEDTTDAAGRFTVTAYPMEATASACLRLAYSSALFVDTPGVALDPARHTPDTLRVNLVGP
jgi:hypothetical protein